MPPEISSVIPYGVGVSVPLWQVRALVLNKQTTDSHIDRASGLFHADYGERPLNLPDRNRCYQVFLKLLIEVKEPVTQWINGVLLYLCNYDGDISHARVTRF